MRCETGKVRGEVAFAYLYGACLLAKRGEKGSVPGEIRSGRCPIPVAKIHTTLELLSSL